MQERKRHCLVTASGARASRGRDRGGQGVGHIPLLDVAPGGSNADGGAELVGAPGGDPPVVNAVPTDAPAGLREVERNGARGGADLVVEGAGPRGDPGKR